MTTAALTSVTWIRLTVGVQRIDLAPEQDVALRLVVLPVEYEGYLDPLTVGPQSELHVSVDLVPEKASAVGRCEQFAREVATGLGAFEPPLAALHEFSLDAGLDGEGLPYNRVTVPKLLLIPGSPPMFDEDQPVPAVRVFTAKAASTPDGAYLLTRSE
jgi:hypothetical protein